MHAFEFQSGTQLDMNLCKPATLLGLNALFHGLNMYTNRCFTHKTSIVREDVCTRKCVTNAILSSIWCK